MSKSKYGTWSKEARDITGVIYPLPYEVAMNIFKKKKNIFVKYLTHEPTKRTEILLKNGMKLFIYSSKSNKSIIGEAVIEAISFMNLFEILSKFKEDLFITESELRKYSEGREHKKAQVLKIKDIILYNREKPINKPITMTGIYVTNQNKKELLGI